MNDMDQLDVAITADTSGFEQALDDLTRRADRFGARISSALAGAVVGGKSFETVLSQLGRQISSMALDAALKPLTGLASGTIDRALGALSGGLGLGDGLKAAGPGVPVQPFAKGGVVAAPSFFPSGGKLGLMGEAGAEAVLPLQRGADGTLGVATAGRGQNAPLITFNVTSPDAASFKRSEAQIQAMLARAAMRGQRGL